MLRLSIYNIYRILFDLSDLWIFSNVVREKLLEVLLERLELQKWHYVENRFYCNETHKKGFDTAFIMCGIA